MSNKEATILINTFTQGVLFKIKNSTNNVVYSLMFLIIISLNYQRNFMIKDNYFCFNHINSHESDEEIYGEVSYDFQIYYDNELSDYQMFIMQLISGKIYTIH